MELERFYLVILRQPDVRPELSEQEVEALQKAHLAYLLSLREEGVLALNGPLRDQPDPTLRGLSFYRTETAEQARAYAEADPMVLAGWFVFDQLTFLSRPGEIRRGGTLITLPD